MACRPCCTPLTPENGWCLGASNQGVISLPLGNASGGPVFATETSRVQNTTLGTGTTTYDYDWTSIVPALTGTMTVNWSGPCNPGASGGQAGTSLAGPFAGQMNFQGSPTSNRNCMKCYDIDMTFSRPVELFKMDLLDFDSGYFARGGEWVYDIFPPYDNLVSTTVPGLEQTTTPNTFNRPACALDRLPFQGPGVGVVKGTGTNTFNQNGHIAWDGVFTQSLQWSWNIPDRLNVAQATLEIAERGIAVSAERCDGEIRWVRSTDGVELTPEEIAALVKCRPFTA